MAVSLRTRLLLALCLALLAFGGTPLAARSHAQPSSPSTATGPFAGLTAVPASRAASHVAVITIKGPIGNYTAASVRRRFDDAIKAGADGVVIDLDTPGGEVPAVLNICTTIKQSPIKNVIAWVNPMAYSGGAIIALACREIVVSDAATLGDAAPIIAMPGLGMMPKLGDTERAKALAPLLAEVVESARMRGYDEKLVQGLVTLGVELWLVESAENPGQRLFIDRAEYRLLFGGEPTGSSPRLVGLPDRPKLQTPAAPSSPAGTPADASPAPSATPDAPGDKPDAAASKGSAPAEPPMPSRFVPASPSMTPVLTANVSAVLDARSTRPILTAADTGKWKLVEHVSDGNGIFTFKRDDLWRYGLAVKAPVAALATYPGTINSDEQLKAFVGASSIGRLDQSGWETAAAFMAHPIVRGLLIVVFLLGLFVEITHPGLILPGSVAAGALVALLAPPLLMGLAAWWAAAAIVTGVSLLVLEILVLPGMGVFGVLGLLLLFGGLVGSFLPTASQGLFPGTGAQSDLLYGIATVGVSTAVSMVGMYFIGKHFGSLPFLNKLILSSAAGARDDEAGSSLLAAMGPADAPAAVGDMGIALTPLRPSGRVRIGDKHLDVVAESGFIASGDSVRVSSVTAFRIVVEGCVPAAATPPPPNTLGATG